MIVAGLCISGCGYHFAASGDVLPQGAQTIYVKRFGNLTRITGINVELMRYLKDEIALHRRLTVVDSPDAADLQLSGMVRLSIDAPINFNGVYEPPRRVLRALGARLVEMPRHGPNSFCCGAGGGRIWMKDTPGTGERPAENRVKEAIALPGVECLVVACPKDLVMFQDAVKTVGAEGRLRVVDLGELVYEAMGILEPTT